MMILIVRFRRVVLIVITTAILLIGGAVYSYPRPLKITPVFVDQNLERKLTMELQLLFDIRNNALLRKDKDTLANIYNQRTRNGIWAYEHELKKMKYIHHWAEKQSIEFLGIESAVQVTGHSASGEGHRVTLTVSTEYMYAYKDDPAKINTFRIGTYHSLSLMPTHAFWHITREWYTDPFADSLDLDRIDSADVQQIILSEEYKDLSQIDERRLNAVAYADKYAGAANHPDNGNKYNTDYRNYNPLGGDCANFASQILFEGGSFRKNRTWGYSRGSGSRAWVNAHAFNSYMLNSGRASVIARGTYEKVLRSSYKLLPGDYVAYEKKGKVTHISVVTGVDSRGYSLVNSHNTDRYRVPWDLGWSNGSIRFVLVRVHY